jgi:hypothetical protein
VSEWGILMLGGQQFLHVVYITGIRRQFLPLNYVLKQFLLVQS